MTTYTISHERYGDRTEFTSLAEAQATIRECGPEFAAVELTAAGENITDERGEIIGSIADDILARQSARWAAEGTDSPHCRWCGRPAGDPVCRCARRTPSEPDEDIVLAEEEVPHDE